MRVKETLEKNTARSLCEVRPFTLGKIAKLFYDQVCAEETKKFVVPLCAHHWKSDFEKSIPSCVTVLHPTMWCCTVKCSEQ